MKTGTLTCLIHLFIILFFSYCCNCNIDNKEIPCIEKRGEAVQLIVDGKPYLVLGGELHNSSSSSREYMKNIWPKLDSMNINTVLAAVEWSLVEPEEGKYDFSLIDGLLEDARKYNLRLGLLWFGTWKNGQTHYAPQWVKSDYKRFPRIKTEKGKSLEIITPLSEEALKSDSRAFAALMKHIKFVDSIHRTIIMIQVENEVGIIGATRDFSELANKIFNNPVPAELTDYLVLKKDSLLPEMKQLWTENGNKSSGTWEEIFGKGPKTDEIFMAWHYAKFINSCVKTGKAEYTIPMFVNAWIVQPQDLKPGDYPSGGAQAHMLDIWKAGAPDVDLYCPDIYLPNFEEICALYNRNGNPLFIPESFAGEQGIGNLILAVGKFKAIGYSPFGVETRVTLDENDQFPAVYKLLSDMAPAILDAQSKNTITSVSLKKNLNSEEEVLFSNYKLKVELLKGWGVESIPELGYGIFIQTATNEYIIAGKNIQVSFLPNSPGTSIAAIASVDEGRFENGKWIQGRRLNGDDIMLDYDLAKKADENKTGTGLKFPGNGIRIQKVKLYRYE